MTSERRLQRVNDLAYSKVGEQVLVVVAKTREVHLLNDCAARIWELLETPETLAGLMEALEEEYDLDPAAAGQEVGCAVREMIEKGLVRALPA